MCSTARWHTKDEGAEVEDDDEPKLNGAAGGFMSGTAGGVLGTAPKENGEGLTSGCFFS